MNTITKSQEKKYLTLIGVLSVAIPVVVAILLFIPQTGKLGDLDVSFLPHLNAVMNSACAACLIAGFIAIKQGNQDLHRTLMMAAFVLGSIFLVSYVVYHFQGTPTYFGDYDGDGVVTDIEKANAGVSRTIYLVVLLTHIVLSAIVVPLVLLALYFAWTKQWLKHKKIVKWTWPVWTYVAVTGVVVYMMIRQFYV
ncbi:DUF420 domain-containing protein [Limibacter armeniacum]|uniref:DUF420 domain-containing protein n=1 Tax=Limibacter armeniacum TaxID=466084 RepID=UPI002FE5F787